MLPKKNPDKEIGRNSTLYFLIGLNLMLFFTWYGLNYKSYPKDDYVSQALQLEEDFEDDIPITNISEPTPPPPPPAAAPEVINVVENIDEVEETLIESTETSQSEEIEERVISIEEANVDDVDEDIEVPFAVVESVPIFPGCKGKNNEELRACFQEKVQEHIKDNFKYPEAAIDLGIYGKVYTVFVIGSDGNVQNIKTRGPSEILEKEAKRIVSLLPKMVPGKQRDRNVKVQFGIPISFKLVAQ